MKTLNKKQELNREESSTNTRWKPVAAKSNLKAIVNDHNWGIKLLPDVRWFKVETSEKDWLFHEFDIEKREHKPILEMMPFRNRKINRYVVWQLLRLERLKARGDIKAYFRVVWALMSSKSYVVLSLNEVLRRWYKEQPYYKVLQVAKYIRKLVRQRETYMEFNRVYIPKKKGIRPLGCPTPAWRVYLHMYGTPMKILLADLVTPVQNAYIPGRGVLTAWQQIVEHLANNEYNVYEFDLKGFFDSVKPQAVLEYLEKKAKMPEPELAWLSMLLRSVPKLPTNIKMSEHIQMMKRSVLEFAWMAMSNPHSPIVNFETGKMVRVQLAWENPRLKPSLKTPEFRQKMELQRIEAQKQWMKDRVHNYHFHGLPQGSPLSPLLSILPLDFIVSREEEVKSVLYADDGIEFTLGREVPKFTHKRTVWSGVERNMEKSGWVRFDGVWLKPLRFLGIEYDGARFRARTRNGASLEWEDSKRFLIWLKDNWRSLEKQNKGVPDSQKLNLRESLEVNFREQFEDFKLANPTWEEDFKSRFLGFMFSRLQGDSWNPEVSQSFTLRALEGSLQDMHLVSWMRKKCIGEKLQLYNSSSFSCHCLWQDLDREYNLRRLNGKVTIGHVGRRILNNWNPIKRLRWVFTKSRGNSRVR